MSYDTSHVNADKIYRVSVDFYRGDAFQVADAQCFPGAGPFAVAEFPEIDDYAMLRERGKFVIKYGDKAFNEDKVYLANASWLTMFDWNLTQGNRETALQDPHMIVISESMAEKYFGDENPMGKMISVIPGEEELQMMVNGVFKDVQPNSHVQFDALISYETRVQTYGWKYDDWQSNNEFMYLLSNQSNLTDDFENKLNERYHSKIGPFSERGNKLKIQALTDIHLKSDKTYEAQPNGSQRIVNILILVALFVLVVAWVNYINLSTARAMERGKEVGVRKVLGSSKGALVIQFLIEAAFLNLISIVLTITSVQLVLPLFNKLAGLELSVSILANANGLAQVLITFLVGTVATGLYPAFVLSNFRPLSVLKGKVKDSQSGRMLRKGLVVFQFLITMLLLIGTMTIYQQVEHMRSQKLGVNLDRTIVVEAPIVAEANSSQTEKRKTFQAELTRLPQIGAVAFTETVFGQGTNEMNSTTGIYRVGDEQGKGVNFYFYRVDDQFLQTFDFQILAGRPFRKELETPYEDDPGQSKGMIINETSRKIMGFASNEVAIGKQVSRNGRIFNIIGVINDYNHHSLKRGLDPIVLFYDRTGRSVGYTSIKVKTGEGNGYKKALSDIEAVYREIFPDSDFSYHFLDEKFDEQYQADQQFGSVFTTFAIITIFVSILGLFGLALYEIQQRIKEIGIRKVLGASAPTIIKLLARDFMKLIFISVVVALPLAYFGMDAWLSSYAYRISISWYLFVLPAVVLLAVALTTIIGQTIKVARRNPVDALRYE
ncbi:MAG: ABC transporter permease [Roseivirga sp.]